MANLLFICSKNQWRSPTAELLFKNHPAHQARSAGISEKARIKVSQKLLEWADVVFVMEKKHKHVLAQKFNVSCQIVIMDIEDDYQFNDPELIDILRISLKNYL